MEPQTTDNYQPMSEEERSRRLEEGINSLDRNERMIIAERARRTLDMLTDKILLEGGPFALLEQEITPNMQSQNMAQWCLNREISIYLGIETIFTKHHHKCKNPDCGHIWEHDAIDTFFKSDDSYQRTHNCPRCGTYYTKIH